MISGDKKIIIIRAGTAHSFRKKPDLISFTEQLLKLQDDDLHLLALKATETDKVTEAITLAKIIICLNTGEMPKDID